MFEYASGVYNMIYEIVDTNGVMSVISGTRMLITTLFKLFKCLADKLIIDNIDLINL